MNPESENRLVIKRFTLCIAFCLALITLDTAGASAVTEGEFALSLAKVLCFECNTIEEAIETLAEIEIMPEGGWRAREEMTVVKIKEVELAIRIAMAAGLIKKVFVEGALEEVSSDLEFDYSTPAGGTKRVMLIPWYAPIAGPPADPVIIEENESSHFRP